MSKKNKKVRRKPMQNAAAVLGIDSILAQIASMRDNADSFLEKDPTDPDGQEIWKADIKACEAVTAILSALQDEGVGDPEQVHDMIADYRSLAEQYRIMHRRYEEPLTVKTEIGISLCPNCRRQVKGFYPKHCGECGQRLDWNPKGRNRDD